MNVYQYKDLNSIVKDVDPQGRTVSGYFAAFNIKDADGDIIKPGAFAKSIMDNGPQSNRPRVKHLMNHDTSKPLGKLTDLKEDSYGLAYTSVIGSHSLGNDFLKMIDSGLVTEHSIGYRIMKWEKEQDDKDYTLYLTELKLWEGSSLTGWGANEFTPLTGVKGLKVDVMEEKIKALEKFCRNSDATDETIELLLLQLKQMQQYIIDLKSSTEPVNATSPQNQINDNVAKAIKDLHSLFV